PWSSCVPRWRRSSSAYCAAMSSISASRVSIWFVLAITTLISLYPLYGMYVTALTPTFDTIKTPPDILPIHASAENFQRLLLKARDYPRWFSNSLIITLSITAFHVFFDTLSGYAFAKKRFPGRDVL